mmetsp:Transcript_11428/g.22438  ORF Transcript_11428/g.22438 Transcript_11428/m.22438 type:complete len:276 (+) Transcript_11428:1057-1884(+)|eukprot:CAMPEP_0171498510 /NCGR_PEP_ID=MMETSP0958-20121227/7896_1 /TAXON_ID=87120 /ORGANISM="Aurantiochytrium limacinum, Strain ATCCMYA-1381" /LENGTH=275 /DNA_ID=CAMNT_0012032929 /DNA_START=932 /DNA_END=1759 /DNA_ORIENTATION=+
MPGRHQSAQELEFLKEAYKKGLKHEYGGHTLDLMDFALVKRYAEIDAASFKEQHALGIAEVEDALQDQKLSMSDAFVQMEYDRIHARKIAATDKNVGVNEGQYEDYQTNKCDFSPSAQAALARKRATDAAKQSNALRRGLAVIQKELECADPDALQRLRDMERGPQGPSEHIMDATTRDQRRRRRRRGHEQNEAATRMKVRSDLEKRAQRISKEDAFQIHLRNQYTSSNAQEFYRPDMLDILLDPNFEVQNFKNAKSTRYAAARIVALDLKGYKV